MNFFINELLKKYYQNIYFYLFRAIEMLRFKIKNRNYYRKICIKEYP